MTPVVASDLEGTMTSGQTWQGMRDYLTENGRERDFRRFYLRRLPKLILFRFGWVDERRFKEQWILDLLSLFAGITVAEFKEVATYVVEETLWPHRRPSVVTELQQHRAAGRRVVIVSGLFQPILDRFARKISECEAIGTPVAFKNGRFTGQIAAPLNVGAQKAAQLKPFLANGRLAAAYGDTMRDIPMLELSDEPVAVHPDDTLRETAVTRGWRILTDEL